MNLQLHAGYFSIKNPFSILDRWLNPFHHKDNIKISGKNMAIYYSTRAEKALKNRQTSLVAELQLYFTCVVQKHVLFHEKTSQETVTVNDKLEVIYRTVQSNACDPVEFAKNHPVKKELDSTAAKNMRPSFLHIDYINKQWIGEFGF